MAVFVTGDTHGEQGRFLYTDTPFEKAVKEDDTLIVAGDFGYIFSDTPQERKFLELFVEKPYTTCFVDGNHENFQVLNSYLIENYYGGKAHIIKRDGAGKPKLVHLMRGQIYDIERKKILTFGGALSIDKHFRSPGRSWWADEMPKDSEYEECLENLKRVDYKVDYIITHTAPLNKVSLFYKDLTDERPLNNFLQNLDDTVSYRHWYFGHFHEERNLDDKHTVLMFQTRNIETNREVVEDNIKRTKFIFGNQNRALRKLRSEWQQYNAFGVYMLTGKPGAGKTTFLSDLFEPDEVEWINKEELDKHIMNHIRYSMPVRQPSSRILFIEFIDDSLTSEDSYCVVRELLKEWSLDVEGNNRLIICTFSDEKKAEQFTEYPILCVSPVKVSASVVKQKADDMHVKLKDCQLWDLSQLDSMMEVVSALHEISVMNE